MIHSIRQLLAAPDLLGATDKPVSFAHPTQLDGSAFRARIAAWEETLAHIDSKLIALYNDNAAEFAAALIAIWRLNKQALIPANNLPANSLKISALTPVFAGDFPGQKTQKPESHNAILTPKHLPLRASDEAALVLFTSGSSGEPEPIAKSFGQLEQELASLEALWGKQIEHASIVSTVSHHHIYGLLFRLLWPLCSGRPMAAHTRDYWEEIAQDATAHADLALITSPAHLSRIPEKLWPQITNLSAVFSSGAPLSADTSHLAQNRLGQSITEIYGSTETGGIAWRAQDSNSHWTCLPGVSVRLHQETSRLEVRSPHLPHDDWFITADTVSINTQDQFTLCGRADRIAKIGGKRISLSAIERLLEQQPCVAQARVVPLPDRADRIGAVIVLSNEGNKWLVDQGRIAINQQLKTALEGHIDRIAIPRYWRYLGAMPQNRQGKTTLADLQLLFSSDSMPRLPEVIYQEAQGDKLLVELYIPTNLYYFDGHFPGRPVLPGVVQTHWAIHYGKEHFGDLGEFSDLEAIKFQQIITANQRIQLQLTFDSEKRKLYFNYTSQKGDTQIAHASGRVVFHAEPAHV